MIAAGGFLIGAILFAQLAQPIHRVFDPFQVERFVSIRQLFSARQLEGLRAKAPDLTVTTITGKQFTLRELSRQNKLVVINFWATYCLPCIAEMPDLEKAHLAYRNRGVAFLGIATEKSASGVRDFIVQQKISYDIALDDQGSIARAFGGIKVLPTTVFLDSENNIVKTHKGYMPKRELENNLKALLLK